MIYVVVPGRSRSRFQPRYLLNMDIILIELLLRSKLSSTSHCRSPVREHRLLAYDTSIWRLLTPSSNVNLGHSSWRMRGGAKHSPHQRTQEMALGSWHLAHDTWHLARGTWFGTCHLALNTLWHLAIGIWHLALCTWH